MKPEVWNAYIGWLDTSGLLTSKVQSRTTGGDHGEIFTPTPTLTHPHPHTSDASSPSDASERPFLSNPSNCFNNLNPLTPLSLLPSPPLSSSGSHITAATLDGLRSGDVGEKLAGIKADGMFSNEYLPNK